MICIELAPTLYPLGWQCSKKVYDSLRCAKAPADQERPSYLNGFEITGTICSRKFHSEPNDSGWITE